MDEEVEEDQLRACGFHSSREKMGTMIPLGCHTKNRNDTENISMAPANLNWAEF
jgi:hypothetical protein